LGKSRGFCGLKIVGKGKKQRDRGKEFETGFTRDGEGNQYFTKRRLKRGVQSKMGGSLPSGREVEAKSEKTGLIGGSGERKPGKQFLRHKVISIKSV